MEKIKLTKLFSRERPFFYFCMWNESDRMGFKKFVGHKVRNNLFIRDSRHNKVSVWYNLKELEQLNCLTAKKVNGNSRVFRKMLEILDKEWKHIGPLLNRKKKIEDINDFAGYYKHLVKWWSAMTLIFNIPEIREVKKTLREGALKRRVLMEKYSDAMHRIYLEFWKRNYPEYWDIAFVVSPREAIKLGKCELSKKDILKIRRRLNGFALFNNKIYTLAELKSTLKKNKITFEKHEVNKEVKEFKGSSACFGVARGTVRMIRFRDQINTFKKGEILVTEMTNPDYIPAMKKAAAIITDEGGVMCHAAIVAREMQKPCIIGTKIATKILKDGDLVEVDADKGIVKIFKRLR